MSVSQQTCELRLNSLFATMLSEIKSSHQYNAGCPAAVRQVLRSRKRASFVNKELRAQAVDGFIANNNHVAQRMLSCDRQLISDARYFITTVLERVTSEFDEGEIQNTLNLELLFNLWRFGPGASNGVKGTHTAEKIERKMTSTSRCAPLVFKLRQLNTYFQLNDKRKGCIGIDVVQGSRLTTVPKNEDTERTIAIEPSGNMALQLAAGSYLTLALRHIGLDIRSQQPRNKALALRGSIDGSIATIDLKSASDLYGLDLIRLLLPEPWVRLLETIRSEQIEINGDQVKLNMVSTMGNGFTFPLMTLVNCALLYGYRAQRGGPNLFIDWRSSAVFGDDIIVPTEEYDGFCEVLESVGLIVNRDKSYCAGPFRESCGGDYHNGDDITPFYAQSLSCDSDVYVVMNQVLSWSAKTKILLPMTLLALRHMLQGKILLVPEWCNPTSGVLTALVPRRYKYLSPVIAKCELQNKEFLMMLAVGGYVASSGPDVFYSPRQYKTKWVVRKSRLPNGYLDGSDRTSRTEPVTVTVATLVATVFHDVLLSEGIVL